MGRIKGYYEWDDDHLTPGQKKGGGLHQNLFDSDGNLKGSARFIPADGCEGEHSLVTETAYVQIEQRRRTQDEEELAQAIAELVSHLVNWGVAKAKPYAEKRWQKLTGPAIDGGRVKMIAWHLRRSAKTTTTVANGMVVAASQKSTDAPGDGRPEMFRAEAQARLLAAFAARAYSDEQMWLVGNADLVDSEDFTNLKRTPARLPEDRIRVFIEAMETKPSILGEDTLVKLASLLGRQGL